MSFSESTTLHGLKQVCDTEQRKLRKLFWVIVFSIMTAAFIGLSTKTLIEYSRYESYTSSQSILNDTLEFPAVTICNFNRVSTNKTLELGKEFSIFMSSGREALLNATGDNPLLFKSYAELAKALAPNVDNTVIWCQWKGKAIPCRDYLTLHHTDGGVCNTFSQSKNQTKFINNQAGRDFSLDMIIDIHTEMYSDFSPLQRSYGSGMELLVHKASSWPLMSSGAISLSQGYHYFLGIHEQQKHRLSTPYSENPCMNTDINTTYNREYCLYECKTRLHLADCNCDPFSEDKAKTCNFLKLTECYNINIIDNYDTECDCPIPCSETTYNVKHSFVEFPHQSQIKNLINKTQLLRNNINDIRKNIVYIQIYFDNMEYTVIKQIEAFSILDLTANIGGLLGLFLGASLITLTELIEFGVISILNIGNKNKVESLK